MAILNQLDVEFRRVRLLVNSIHQGASDVHVPTCCTKQPRKILSHCYNLKQYINNMKF